PAGDLSEDAGHGQRHATVGAQRAGVALGRSFAGSIALQDQDVVAVAAQIGCATDADDAGANDDDRWLAHAVEARQACERNRRQRVSRKWTPRAAMHVAEMTQAIAMAKANSPASSMLMTAIDARLVSVEYRKTTADTVVIALRKK